MRTPSRRLLALVLAAGSMTALAAQASPPADAEVDAAVSQFTAAAAKLDRADREGREAAAAEALAGLSIGEMTPAQLKKLTSNRVPLSPEQRAAAFAHLSELAKGQGADGAAAAIARVDFIPTLSPTTPADQRAQAQAAVTEARAQAVIAALRHPGLGGAFKAGEGADLFMQLRMAGAANLKPALADIVALERLLTPDLPPAVAARAVALFDFISSEDLEADEATRERFRATLSALLESSSAKLGDDQQQIRESMVRSKAYLDGAYARGRLVGHEAPALDIVWSSTQTPIKSLAELRGNIVVLDFWATWCGPCVGSFPNVRELVAHYEGYPVKVIGVTAIQGSHTNMNATDPALRRIDTKDDPAREMALMSDYIKEMDMTWPVVFAKQDVFNPDYGVRGIPHVVIIDAKGVVRYRGLHPASPMAEKTDKIDALLKEAGLPAPGADAPAPGTAAVESGS